MKIIFVFNTFYKTSFFYELCSYLEQEGYSVEIYDLVSSCSYNFKKKKTTYFKPFLGANLLLKVKGVRRLFKPLINKKIINKTINNNDIVNFHYVDEKYVKYSEIISKKTTKIVTTFWGSDLLRVKEHTLKHYTPLIENSKVVTMVPGIQDVYKVAYPQFVEKLRTTIFGLSILDEIRKVELSDTTEFKIKYNLPDNKIFITLGYNASPAQQHKKLINYLSSLKENLKENFFLLIPLTYGGNKLYFDELLNCLEKSNLNYKTFFDFMPQKELAILRCISDITLNIQVTDAFSASISESLVAKNLVLVGDWLPYEIYNTWGVKIFKSSLDIFKESLENILNSFDDYKEELTENSDRVYEKLRWSNTIKLWTDVYDEVKS